MRDRRPAQDALWLLAGRLRRPLGAVLVAAAVGISGAAIWKTTTGSGGEVPPGPANLWVDTDGGSCTRSRSPAAYSDAAACASMNAAYQAASLGDTVTITCPGSTCTYSTQTIVEDAGKSGTSVSTHVLFNIAAGKTVTIRGINLGTGDTTGGTDGPDHITINGGGDWHNSTPYRLVMPYDNVNSCAIRALPDSYDDTVTGVDVCSTFATMIHNWTVTNSDLGPCRAENSGVCQQGMRVDNGTGVNGDVTYDGNYFHDFTRSDSASHWECGVIWGLQDGTVGFRFTRNELWRCATLDLGFYQEGPTDITTPALFENNFFDHPTDLGATYAPAGQAAINVKNNNRLIDTHLRFNTFADGASIYWATVVPLPNAYINTDQEGNIGQLDCQPTYPVGSSYNLGIGGACGGTGDTTTASLSNVLVDATLTDPTDFHLKSGTNPAVDLVPIADCPSTDIFGNARTGSFCDAGAVER